ncbi:MAG: alpha/beta fold hydrolase, partial [Gammaproteobacteria bacterium]|nr:alpha/beta fold hydrolase [Gammaproteobacteria bacterium]
LLHGQPSWSFLNRKMVKPLTDAGFRVIVPDLVGFGKSEKPLSTRDHNYQMHIDTMTELARQLDLNETVFFGQDWGGLIGLRVVAAEPGRFKSIVLSNTGLPYAKGLKGWLGYPLFKLAVWREGKPESIAENGKFRFTRWVAWAATTPDFDLARLFQTSTTTELSDAEIDAYRAPFPDESYMAAIRKFPSMVPSQLRQNAVVMQQVFATWEKPLITCFSDGDPVTKGMDKIWQHKVPGAKGMPHVTIEGSNHFVQEDSPLQLVEVIKQAAALGIETS